MARFCNSVLDAIGHTPLIALNRFSEGNGCDLFVKLESTNPGGSMKDRAAAGMVERVEREHNLQPGAEIIVCTSGNLGVGMAMVCAVKGFQLVCVVDPKINPTTEHCLKLYGAEVIKVYQRDETGGYHLTRLQKVSAVQQERPNAVYLDQYDSPAAIAAHYNTTGPEILEALDGRVDALVMVAGTGGSSMGIARYFREHSPQTHICLVDEHGSLALPGNAGCSNRHLNGMGTSIVPSNYPVDDFDRLVDQVVYVHAGESIAAALELARCEGILTGGTGGAAVAVMRRAVAPRFEAGARLVALLPDHGSRYTDTQFSREWLAARDIYVPALFDDKES